MEGTRFDRLARSVATSGSRRRVLGAMLAGALGSLRIRATAADDSGTAIADASGGDHNQATVVDPATGGTTPDRHKNDTQDNEKDEDEDEDKDRDNDASRDCQPESDAEACGSQTCGTAVNRCGQSVNCAGCAGCCSGTSCENGDSNGACGTQGVACSDCGAAGQTCVENGLCATLCDNPGSSAGCPCGLCIGNAASQSPATDLVCQDPTADLCAPTDCADCAADRMLCAFSPDCPSGFECTTPC